MHTGDQLCLTAADLTVRTLGPATVPSPLDGSLLDPRDSVHYVAETDRVLLDDTLDMAVRRGLPTRELPAFEPGGPRSRLFFDPPRTRVGVVTCGGLCPGLNNVIRGLVLEACGHYGVASVTGFRNGYRGLTRAGAADAVELTPAAVRGINDQGGTVLGTSRGGQDPAEMVDTLVARGIDVLFVIGGDGTLRGGRTSPTRPPAAACRSPSSTSPRRSTTTSRGSTPASASRPRSAGPPSPSGPRTPRRGPRRTGSG